MAKTKKSDNTNSKKNRPSWLRRIWNFVWGKKWWILLVIALAFIAKLIFGGTPEKKQEYATVKITHGDLRQVVSATGEIQPVNTVNVGSQVSGTIDNLYVDFNTKSAFS